MGDMYAEPIALNFKGREKFVSVTGGIFSLIVRTLILCFFIMLGLSKLNQHGEMVIQVEEEIDFEELQEQTESLMWD